jgi:hypothetical protein
VTTGGDSVGTYSFGTIWDTTNRWLLTGAFVDLKCREVPEYHPPMADTTWSTLLLETNSGGTLAAVYYTEEDTCGLEMGCGSDDENDGGGGDGGGGGGGGGGDGGGGSSTCYYYVAADENGIPLLDDGGNWYILAFLGCT